MSDTNYMVCKLIRWTDFEINWPGGRVEELRKPPGEEDIIGFMPVYRDLKSAVQDADGFVILPIVVRVKNTEEEAPHGDDTEES